MLWLCIHTSRSIRPSIHLSDFYLLIGIRCKGNKDKSSCSIALDAGHSLWGWAEKQQFIFCTVQKKFRNTCMPSLHRGHDNLCIIPALEYVLPEEGIRSDCGPTFCHGLCSRLTSRSPPFLPPASLSAPEQTSFSQEQLFMSEKDWILIEVCTPKSKTTTNDDAVHRERCWDHLHYRQHFFCFLWHLKTDSFPACCGILFAGRMSDGQVW